MLILGDFASYKSEINFQGINVQDTLLLNCEGYLSDRIESDHLSVFNNINLFIELSKRYSIILNLANNHTMDIPTGISQSILFSNKYKIPTVGGGRNLKEACESYIFVENDIEIAIVAAGWEIIGCISATKKSEGVASLNSTRLLQQVRNEKKIGRKVVVYLHWGYELEVYPQPTHRYLAKRLIDYGADLIVGCHSHCLQGFEKYKNRYIFYGLGNSVFDENYYFSGKLKFPEFCKVGLAVKWDVKTDEILVSTTHYKDSTLFFDNYINPENINDIVKLSSFSNLNHVEYIYFFKKNRRKKTLLPIFYETDTNFSYQLKKIFLKIRAFIIKKMFLLGLKGHSR